MGTAINVDFTKKMVIKDSVNYYITPPAITGRKLADGLMSPAKEEVVNDILIDHTSEPIKNVDDIIAISQKLISEKRYRDNMLFVLGINLGLRVSDLILLRFCDLINEDFTFKTTFPIFEKKTRNTRKKKHNRYLSINDAVMDAVTLYLTHNPSKLDDYLFRSKSNNGAKSNKPISRVTVDVIVKEITSHLGIKASTHTLRKTFAYHQMLASGNDQRKLLLLQKMFGHSTVAQTLDYIGITGEEMREAYLSLNLGSPRTSSPIDSTIDETPYETVYVS